MELIRTQEQLTAGIVNVPLSKPAKLFFILNEQSDISQVLLLFQSLGIDNITQNTNNKKVFISSEQEIEPNVIKLVFRNFRSLRPKLKSDWRYLFWEIDTQDDAVFQQVINVYRYLQLPIYIHKTMRGYHFLSVKPISKDIFQWAITQLRPTNDKYPPITLRIKPNKWVGEEKVFSDGFIMSEKLHTDTKQLRDWIISQNFEKIQQQYQLVWYNIDKIQEIEQ